MTATLAPGARTRQAVWAFGPPLVWAALRSWAQWQDGRQPAPDAFPMHALDPTASAVQIMLPWALGLLALVVGAAGLRWWWRRGGQRVVGRLLWGLWVLLWLCAVLALFGARANRQDLVAQAPVAARVLGVRSVAPSVRQPGGVEAVVVIDGVAQLQRVRVPGDAAALWRAGARLQLELANGRWYGRYVLGAQSTADESEPSAMQ